LEPRIPCQNGRDRLKSGIRSADCLRVRRLTPAIGLLAALLPLGGALTLPVHAATRPVGSAAAAGGGRWSVDAAGRVRTSGGAPSLGTLPARAGRRIVGIAATASGRGYWLASAQGGVFTFGDARFHGSVVGRQLARPISRIALLGRGYQLISASGAAYPFGATAPPTVAAAPGARQPWLWPFASTSPWNMPLGSGARFAGDADTTTRNFRDPSFVPWVNAGKYSHPIVMAAASDPVVTLYERGKVVEQLHLPAAAVPAAGTDGHLHIVDPGRRWIDETWNTTRSGTTASTSYHVRTDLTGPGVGQGGVRAYGGSAIGGLIRTWELQQGSIRHAIAIALASGQLRTGWAWPATAQDGDAASSYHGAIPMGSLLAIPSSVDVDALGLSGEGRMVAHALQDYGAYVVDRSSGPTLYAEPAIEGSTALSHLREAVRTLRNQLRVVTNNGPESVGGPGVRRAPLAPAI
jgi:hypothetical protein